MRWWVIGAGVLVAGVLVACSNPSPPPAPAEPPTTPVPTAAETAGPSAGPTAGPTAEAAPSCGDRAEALRETLRAANTCRADADCERITAPCLAVCGMAVARAALTPVEPAVASLREDCARACSKADCKPWTSDPAVCREGRCALRGQPTDVP